MTLAADDPRHGIASSYVNHACRCQPCRDAWSKYHQPYGAAARRRRGQLPRKPARPIDEIHGTRYAYVKRGCRCAECRKAAANYQADYRKRCRA